MRVAECAIWALAGWAFGVAMMAAMLLSDPVPAILYLVITAILIAAGVGLARMDRRA